MTETHRLLIAIASIGLYMLWVAVLFFKHKKQPSNAVTGEETLVVYASQTGTAEKVARAKAAALSEQEQTLVVSMASLKLNTLSAVSKVIFVVSTYGEGEPPDAGRTFSKALKKASSNQSDYLSHLSFEVVGLGDKQYAAFCQFAVTLFDNISALGARALSPLMTLDAGKGEHLALLDSLPEDAQHPTHAFTLKTRVQLNEVTLASGEPLDEFDNQVENQSFNSASPGLFGLSLSVDNTNHTQELHEQWEAGDVLEVLIPQQAESSIISRSYTIASVPQEHDIKLVVRQLVKDNGQFGIGSGLLTHTLPLSQSLQGYIRKNSSAIITDTQCPLLLIAAGSGIAGVRAQLAKRALLENAGPVWIFFGERHPSHDNVLDKTLSPFQHGDCIFQKSVIFSRQEGGGYVQQRLIEQQDEVKSFLGDTGQVYVCGQFEGMGQGVDTALQSILKEQAYNALADEGRYHRDLY
ncbi:flavodoxin domain-containing protein [Alteromonas sp. ALT199]|uniref:flavodoxin domain-containing protein n=1 Tax=unclassified Alteromonas TaxID=2614992 RepID=UPI001BE62675|nr:flavodoxin domain-containing protein [Alteromonas sp. ALT199]MBT3137262.1 flavodoxin domain-containing protein [Alteromonas sp. ALT199]